jgi:hypothetical protein
MCGDEQLAGGPSTDQTAHLTLYAAQSLQFFHFLFAFGGMFGIVPRRSTC